MVAGDRLQLPPRWFLSENQSVLYCVGCDALYEVVRAEAGPESSDGEIPCRVCGAPLAPRDGEYVLKYFLLRKAGRQQGLRKRQSDPRSESPADP